MLRAFWFILAFFTQLIAIAMWGEYVWLSRVSNGGIVGTPIEQVQPVIWWLLAIEVLLFIGIAIFKKQEK